MRIRVVKFKEKSHLIQIHLVTLKSVKTIKTNISYDGIELQNVPCYQKHLRDPLEIK